MLAYFLHQLVFTSHNTCTHLSSNNLSLCPRTLSSLGSRPPTKAPTDVCAVTSAQKQEHALDLLVFRTERVFRQFPVMAVVLTVLITNHAENWTQELMSSLWREYFLLGNTLTADVIIMSADAGVGSVGCSGGTTPWARHSPLTCKSCVTLGWSPLKTGGGGGRLTAETFLPRLLTVGRQSSGVGASCLGAGVAAAGSLLRRRSAAGHRRPSPLSRLRRRRRDATSRQGESASAAGYPETARRDSACPTPDHRPAAFGRPNPPS